MNIASQGQAPKKVQLVVYTLLLIIHGCRADDYELGYNTEYTGLCSLSFDGNFGFNKDPSRIDAGCNAYNGTRVSSWLSANHATFDQMRFGLFSGFVKKDFNAPTNTLFILDRQTSCKDEIKRFLRDQTPRVFQTNSPVLSYLESASEEEISELGILTKSSLLTHEYVFNKRCRFIAKRVRRTSPSATWLKCMKNSWQCYIPGKSTMINKDRTWNIVSDRIVRNDFEGKICNDGGGLDDFDVDSPSAGRNCIWRTSGHKGPFWVAPNLGSAILQGKVTVDSEGSVLGLGGLKIPTFKDFFEAETYFTHEDIRETTTRIMDTYRVSFTLEIDRYINRTLSEKIKVAIDEFEKSEPQARQKEEVEFTRKWKAGIFFAIFTSAVTFILVVLTFFFSCCRTRSVIQNVG